MSDTTQAITTQAITTRAAAATVVTLDSVEVLAKHLKVSPTSVRRFAHSGAIPSYRVGRQLRFDRAEVLEALRAPESLR